MTTLSNKRLQHLNGIQQFPHSLICILVGTSALAKSWI